MKIKDYKCKCGHNDFFFADKGNQKGIYCSYCGKWLKWADKDEQNLAMKQEPTTKIEESNFSQEQYKADLQSAYDCGVASVKQKPRKGKWISKPHVYGVSYCSECDFELKIDDTNYCPNCGAKMEKRLEEVEE